MKLFVTFPKKANKKLLPVTIDDPHDKNIAAYHQLYNKIRTLEGSMVKCGVETVKDLSYFASFRGLTTAKAARKVIAFEKIVNNFYLEKSLKEKEIFFQKSKYLFIDAETLSGILSAKDVSGYIDFIPGHVGDSISAYLIENPDLKIACLIINMDDYEASLTILQFFYPRLVIGGILVIENYYKREDDYRAITEFFKYFTIEINSLTNQGPNYIVRN